MYTAILYKVADKSQRRLEKGKLKVQPFGLVRPDQFRVGVQG